MFLFSRTGQTKEGPLKGINELNSNLPLIHTYSPQESLLTGYWVNWFLWATNVLLIVRKQHYLWNRWQFHETILLYSEEGKLLRSFINRWKSQRDVEISDENQRILLCFNERLKKILNVSKFFQKSEKNLLLWNREIMCLTSLTK